MNRRTFLGSLLGGIAGLFLPVQKPATPLATPYLGLRFIKQARFDIINRANIIALNAIQKEEDENIFRAIKIAQGRIA